jgi:hypothetical protein
MKTNLARLNHRRTKLNIACPYCNSRLLCGHPKYYSHKFTECQCGKFNVITQADNNKFYISTVEYDGFKIYASRDDSLWLRMNDRCTGSSLNYTKLLQSGTTIDLADIPKLVMLM